MSRDRASARKIETIAQELAQSGGANLLHQAQIAAEAELELTRVRAACEAIIARTAAPTGATNLVAVSRALAELEKLDRYERRALSKRKRALRAL
jgi:hypothetical protein